MALKRFSLLAGVVAVALSATGADAAYTYTTAITITSPSGATSSGGTSTVTSSNGTTVTLQNITSPGSFLVGSPLTANIGNVGVTTTSTVADSFAVGYTDVITITNNGATGTFTVTGTLTLSNVQASGGAVGGTVTNQYNAPYTQGPIFVGGNSFTLGIGTGMPNDLFGPPTIGNGTGATASGSLGGVINSTAAVPEPASIALCGIAGVMGLAFARRKLGA
jgi:hypothetical protein